MFSNVNVTGLRENINFQLCAFDDKQHFPKCLNFSLSLKSLTKSLQISPEILYADQDQDNLDNEQTNDDDDEPIVQGQLSKHELREHYDIYDINE